MCQKVRWPKSTSFRATDNDIIQYCCFNAGSPASQSSRGIVDASFGNSVPGAAQSQPQLDQLPKHSKDPVAGTHASPLKVVHFTQCCKTFFPLPASLVTQPAANNVKLTILWHEH